MDDFKNVNKKDIQKRIKINVIIDRYTRLPYKFQSRIGYDSLIQNVILTELIKIMDKTITDLDIELKLKNSRTNYLETKNSYK